MKLDSFQSITSSAKKFFAGTLLSRTSGMVREILMAACFGVDPAVASFLVAFRLSNFLRRFLGEGLFQSSFIPHFESLKNANENEAYSFFSILSRKISLTSLILIGIFCLMFLGLGLKEGSFQQTYLLSAIMFPSLLFISLFTLNSALLQCEKIYFIPSFAPALFNLIWIVFLLLSHFQFREKAMVCLSIGILIAYFFQWIITLPSQRKILKSSSIQKNSLHLGPLMKNLAISLLGIGAYQINSLLDFIFCKLISAVGPIFLAYSSRLYQLPLALFGISFSGAILPPLSRAYEKKDEKTYLNFLNLTLQQVFFIATFGTITLFIFSLSATSLIYGRGLFKAEGVRMTAFCLSAYGLGLLPSCANLILTSALYARKSYKKPLFCTLYSVSFNLSLNALFSFVFQWGAPGIALATSLASYVNMIFLLMSLKKEVIVDSRKILMVFLKTSLICLLSYLAVNFFFPIDYKEILFLKNSELNESGFFKKLFNFVIPFSIYLLIFSCLAYFFKIKEISLLIRWRRKRLTEQNIQEKTN